MKKLDSKFVIIVEDDISSVEVLGQFLTFLGIHYHVIPDGSNILGVIEKFPNVDAVFLDLELSKENGYTILSTIRSNVKLDRIPVIAYTSHTSQKHQARQAGFHSFLGKPLDSIAFPNQLQSILNNQPVWD